MFVAVPPAPIPNTHRAQNSNTQYPQGSELEYPIPTIPIDWGHDFLSLHAHASWLLAQNNTAMSSDEKCIAMCCFHLRQHLDTVVPGQRHNGFVTLIMFKG